MAFVPLPVERDSWSLIERLLIPLLTLNTRNKFLKVCRPNSHRLLSYKVFLAPIGLFLRFFNSEIVLQELECDTNNCLISSLSPDTKYRLRVSAVRLHPLPRQDSDPDHVQAIREVFGSFSSVVNFQTLSGAVVPAGVPMLTSLSELTPVVEEMKPTKCLPEGGENLQKSLASKTESKAASAILNQDSSQALRVIAYYLVSAIFLAYVLSYFCI